MEGDLLKNRFSLVADADYHVLAAMALEAFRQGQMSRALVLIDRCCRIGSPSVPQYFELRAAIRERLGDHCGCLKDLERAARLQPPNERIQRRILHLALKMVAPDSGLAAADAILRRATEPDIIDDTLRIAGRLSPEGFGWCHSIDRTLDESNTLIGLHLFWNGQPVKQLEVLWDGESEIYEITGRHTGNGFEYYAEVEWPWPEGTTRFNAVCDLRLLGARLTRPADRQAAPREDRIINPLPPLPEGSQTDSRRVTIIIPIYRDIAATRACLDSVLAHTALGQNVSVIAVDDASPEPELSLYIEGLAAEGYITCVQRARNGGFIAAVETALDLINDGDVILLNADTVVPEGWLEALIRVSESDERIGTITPLSNNGELTSFPIPFTANSMPTNGELAVLNTMTRIINGDMSIDIPNGIGFCLYITHQCLRRVGRFGNAHLKSGYFEDVDFSLRAAENKFRNVCATGVFVAHSGSASYLDSKRGLVLENLDEVVRQHPDIAARTNWFMARDPLKESRNRLLEALFGSMIIARTAVLASGTSPDFPPEPVIALKNIIEDHLVLDSSAAAPEAIRFSASKPLPFSMQFDLGKDAEVERIAGLLQAAGTERLVHILLGPVPQSLLMLTRILDIPYEVVVLDATALTHEQTRAWLIARANRLYTQSHTAIATLRRLAPAVPVITLTELPRRAAAYHSSPVAGSGPVAVIPLDTSTAAWQDIEAIVRTLHRRKDNRCIIVVGTTINDQALMRLGNVVVLGDVEPAEWTSTMVTHGVSAVAITCGRTLWGDVRIPGIAALPLPIAVRSRGILGELALPPVDLVVPEQATPEDWAKTVLDWRSLQPSSLAQALQDREDA